MKYFLETIIFVIQRLPLEAALYVGRMLGSIAYCFSKKRRQIGYANLRLSFHQRPPNEILSIIKDIYKNIGMNVVEMVRFPLMDNDYLKQYVEVEGKKNIEDALLKNRGLVFLTGHFGNWELASICFCLLGYPLLVLARDQKPKELYSIVNRFRQSKGCRVVGKGMALREIIRDLRENRTIGMLADQNAGKKGIFIRFFNRECSWHTGPFEISNKTGCSIVPIFIVRKHGPYHKLFILPELEGTEQEKLKKFVPTFEDFIRQSPQQWLWMHRRWKTKNDLKITLLTDGKAGHRNQCLKIIEYIKNSYPQQVIINEMPVYYKNRFYKTLVTLGSLFYRQGQIGILKYFLDKNNFEKISFETSDVVVSAGSSTAGINLILSKENLSKSIVLMKPSFLPLKNFTLCIIPQHDRVAKRENVIFTRTAIGSIDGTIIEQASLELKNELNIDKPCIGIFIGGDTRHSRLCPERVEKISREILRVAEEKDFYLLITTSRRTSARIENVISGVFEKNERCRLLVIANRKNRKDVVAAILGLSGVVVVSAESMSMIAEACSSRRYVVAFLPKKVGFLKTKHEKAVQRLQTQRFLKIADQETIYNIIKQAIDMNLKHRAIQDDLRIRERLKNILARI